MKQPKHWTRSKTIAVNAVVALPLVIDQLAELVSASADLIPDNVSKWALFALAAVNIVLRGVTSQPVAMRNQDQ